MILNNNFYTRKPTIPGLDAKRLNTDDAYTDDLHRSNFGAHYAEVRVPHSREIPSEQASCS